MQQQVAGAGTTSHKLHSGASTGSQCVRMHPVFLYFKPSFWEQQYFAQFEGLDLLNCLITPVFVSSTLARWPRSFLSAVYCLVLAIKGYQMALLLLPAARKARAHAKSRYGLIFAERALRQFIATPALGRGPRFVQWMTEITAADPGPATAFKLAMLLSGVTHSFWNCFCLPLDIVSQVVINVIFFCIHFPPTVTQVAYPVGMLVKHKPWLVVLQWELERAASTLAWPLLHLLQLFAAASIPSASGGGSSSCDITSGSSSDAGGAAGECLTGFAAVSLPPKRAPDLESPAGRLVLAGSVALMLYLVLYVPLLFAWRLERHLKSRFMMTVMRKQAGSSISTTTAGAAASSSISASAAGGKGAAASGKLAAAAVGGVGGGGGDSSSGSFFAPPVVYPVVPGKAAITLHLVVAAIVCFLCGEVFVWMCTVSPTVKGILWDQIPG